MPVDRQSVSTNNYSTLEQYRAAAEAEAEAEAAGDKQPSSCVSIRVSIHLSAAE